MSQTLCSGKVSKIYSLLFKAFTHDKKAISGVQVVKLTIICENLISSRCLDYLSDPILINR